MTGQFRQWTKGPCFYCNMETYRMGPDSNHPQKYTRDHLLPRKLRGGVRVCELPPQRVHDITVTCCLRCNQRKGAKSPEQFLRQFGIPTQAKIRVINRAFALYKQALVGVQKSLARNVLKNKGCENWEA